MTRSVRMLYVDDDVALVRLVQKTFGRRGYEVEHVATGEEALLRIAAGGLDVVALDHFLASGTGLDVLAALNGADHVPAIVYVTGSADMDIAVAALKAGASDYVPKTVGDDFLVLLASAIEKAVEKTRLREQKETAEREVRSARDRAELLLREVNHRVANSLSLVSSLVSLQANILKEPAAKEALAETQARIVAIALVHKRLYTSSDVRFVEIDEYLKGLLDHLETAMQSDGHGARIKASIEHLLVPPDQAVSLGVIVTELVSNAFKYAYPAGQVGEVRVAVQRIGATAGELTVSDDGIGWTGSGKVQGTGLGSRIVKAMAKSIGTELIYQPAGSGTVAQISFALGE